MEELEYLWSLDCTKPEHTGTIRYDLTFFHSAGEGGFQESDFVVSFDHFPDEEEIFAALATWKSAQRG